MFPLYSKARAHRQARHGGSTPLAAVTFRAWASKILRVTSRCRRRIRRYTLADMCGRMTLTRRELIEVADELEAAFDAGAAAAYRPRYNVAPTDTHPVLRLREGARWLEPARWGLPPTGRRAKAPVINARAETARLRDPFRAAWNGPVGSMAGRCVVPADGFFEWKKETREPTWFHRPDGRLLLLAGLWQDGAFTVLTTAPNALVGQIHDRMPAVLSPDEAHAWLAAPSSGLLHPAPEGVLEARPVSTRRSSRPTSSSR